jgi:poly(3-hydroxybutyrate) depolymerase
MAVCQPSVPVLAAVSIMEEDKDPNAPATMTLMGGPIDTRINPTVVNNLAEERGTDWFSRNVIMRVPFPHPGFMRPVYPGFLQLTGFMSMNLDRHMTAHRDLFKHLVDGDGDSADRHRDFYDEYMAVMDLTAEFYLETVETVFVRHALPKGEMAYRDRRVKPDLIRNTALLTVEGERDDISGVGQTKAAHKLCSGLAKTKKAHHLQEKVGHYGVFNGSRFRAGIAPAIKKFIRKHDRNAKTLNGAANPIAGLRENDLQAKFADAMGITALQTNPIPLVADDLTQISGIGPKIADILNDLGIVQIDQLAALTKDMARLIDDELPRGQDAVHDWIEQARTITGLEKK